MTHLDDLKNGIFEVFFEEVFNAIFGQLSRFFEHFGLGVVLKL
jgi:hypothetical protein